MNHPTTTTSDPLTVPARVRLVDVAREAGVSIATVSAVLMPRAGNNTRVSAATAARVTDVAARMNFQPNQAARQLAGKRSGMLGVIVDSMAPEVHFRLLAQLERAVGERGYRMSVGQSHDDPEALIDYARDFAARGVDGVFCLAHDYPSELYGKGVGAGLVKTLAKLNRVLFLGRPRASLSKLCCVYSDTASGVRQACRHLSERGRRKIGLVLANRCYQASLDRIDGFMQAMAELDVERPWDQVFSPAVEQNGAGDHAAMAELAVEELVVRHRCDALVAVNDLMAIYLIKVLKQRGIPVPQAVAVVGYDHLQAGSFYEPALTTVDGNFSDVCQQAAVVMDRWVGGQPPEGGIAIRVEPILILRDSS